MATNKDIKTVNNEEVFSRLCDSRLQESRRMKRRKADRRMSFLKEILFTCIIAAVSSGLTIILMTVF